MVIHAFQVDECPCNLHETNGQHLASLHQLGFGSVFVPHLDLQLELRRDHVPCSTFPSNSVTTQSSANLEKCNFGITQINISNTSLRSGVRMWTQPRYKLFGIS